jgi:uncharacterized membrane protein YbhN (UPF0104 family)
MESTRKRLLLAANLAILALILYWVSEHISLGELRERAKDLPPEGLLGALVLNLAVLGVYGLRLSLLLGTRRLPALATVIIGFGMNGVLPFRLGEVAKLGYARQLFGIAAPRLIAATAAEKLMDLCALLLLGFTASQLVVAPYLDRGIAIASALAGILVTGLALAFLSLAIWERAGRKTHNWITDAFDTLRAQRSLSSIAQLALLTAAIWAITVASVYWMFSSVFPQFSLANACVLTLVLALAIAIPSAPAGLGVVEAAIVAYLHQALQAEPNQALASALAFHVIVVVPQVLTTAAILFGAIFRRHRLKG